VVADDDILGEVRVILKKKKINKRIKAQSTKKKIKDQMKPSY
jgi:hypothetical protein